MFTGLIETTGRVASLTAAEAGAHVRIASALGGELGLGESVAVNGVCLTVTASHAGEFGVDVSPETLRVTAFASLARNRVVNLERPLKADGRLGGHFVQGHVDAVGRVLSVRADGAHHWVEIEFPAALASNFVLKGSVAVDGVSLTVASLSPERFGVQIVPFTWEHTAFSELRAGDPVNLEADMLGKVRARFSAERLTWLNG